MDEFVNKYIDQVVFRAGFDPHHANERAMIADLILAARQDMELAGVSPIVLDSDIYKNIIAATLVIFIVDNLNATSGEFKTSIMYNANIDKLRSLTYAN